MVIMKIIPRQTCYHLRTAISFLFFTVFILPVSADPFTPPLISQTENPFGRNLPLTDNAPLRPALSEAWQLRAIMHQSVPQDGTIRRVAETDLRLTSAQNIFVQITPPLPASDAEFFARQLEHHMDGQLLLPVLLLPGKNDHYSVETGPFSTARHADSYCRFLRQGAPSFASSCRAYINTGRGNTEPPSFSAALLIPVHSASESHQIITEGEILAGTELMLVKLGNREAYFADTAGRAVTLGLNSKTSRTLLTGGADDGHQIQ